MSRHALASGFQELPLNVFEPVKMRRLRALMSCLAVATALTAVGCGDGTDQRQVSGTVTLDGQPVEKGEIAFYPASGNGAPQGGPITDGKFQFQALAGEKRVEITATREAATPAPDGLPNYVSYIPAKYNSQSTLTETVQDSGANTFTFELTSGGQ